MAYLVIMAKDTTVSPNFNIETYPKRGQTVAVLDALPWSGDWYVTSPHIRIVEVTDLTLREAHKYLESEFGELDPVEELEPVLVLRTRTLDLDALEADDPRVLNPEDVLSVVDADLQANETREPRASLTSTVREP